MEVDETLPARFYPESQFHKPSVHAEACVLLCLCPCPILTAWVVEISSWSHRKAVYKWLTYQPLTWVFQPDIEFIQIFLQNSELCCSDGYNQRVCGGWGWGCSGLGYSTSVGSFSFSLPVFLPFATDLSQSQSQEQWTTLRHQDDLQARDLAS